MFDLKALQRMQEQMQGEIGDVQKKMADEHVTAAAGGGAVTVDMNGNLEMTAIKIKPEAVDPEDVEMLEDLVRAAVNQAIEKARDLQQNAMGKVAGGMLPPGLRLPF